MNPLEIYVAGTHQPCPLPFRIGLGYVYCRKTGLKEGGRGLRNNTYRGKSRDQSQYISS